MKSGTSNTNLRRGQLYEFHRDLHDTFLKLRPSEDYLPPDGTLVRITQPFGCPKNGTRGQVYIETEAGEFIGLCDRSSLKEVDPKRTGQRRREKKSKPKDQASLFTDHA